MDLDPDVGVEETNMDLDDQNDMEWEPTGGQEATEDHPRDRHQTHNQTGMEWEPTGEQDAAETGRRGSWQRNRPSDQALDELPITLDAMEIARRNPGSYLEGEEEYRDFFRRARLDRSWVEGIFRIYLDRMADQATDQNTDFVRGRQLKIVEMHLDFMKLDRDAIYHILRNPHGGPKILIPGLRVQLPNGQYYTESTSLERVGFKALGWIKERAIRRFALELDCDPARFL